MYSSSASTASTIPIDKNWCRSVTSKDLSSQRSEFFCPKIQCDDDLSRKLTEPIPLQESIKENEVIYESLDKKDIEVKEKCIAEWAKKEPNNKCTEWNTTRLRLRNRAVEWEDYTTKFLNSPTPWYMGETYKERNWPNNYYCYPKICVKLHYKEVHHKQIIKYFENGIYILLIDLRFGTDQIKIKILEQIETARKILDEMKIHESIITVGFEITGRTLKTGIVKRSQDVFLDRDSIVLLTANRDYSHRCTNRVIYINFADYVERFQKCDIIKIGKRIRVKVDKIWDSTLKCTVLFEGLLTSRMIILIPPERTLEQIDITKEQEEDVHFAVNWRGDFILCQCMAKPKLLHYIRWMTATRKRKISTFARIVWNISIDKRDIDFILNEFTGIWFDGKPCQKHKHIFKYCLKQCLWLNKPIIQYLILTSEIIKFDDDKDAKKNIFMYPTCIAVSAFEGIDPIKVKTVIRTNYPEMNEDTLKLVTSYSLPKNINMECVLLRYMNNVSFISDVTCIIVCNNSGNSVSIISQSRRLKPIIASFTDVATARNLMMLKNVIPLTFYDPMRTAWEDELTERISCCIEYAKLFGHISANKPFMVCYDSIRGIKFSDVFRILYLE